MLKYGQKYGYALAKEEFNHYLTHEAYTQIKYFNQDTYIKKLLRDLNTAKERIRIWLPSGHLGTYTDELKEAITVAIEKGINVGVKCSDYENLPLDWKAFGVQDKSALFPLIIIDGNITWYGAPDARTSFEDKNSKYVSIYKTIVRFKGKHTADMIQSVTVLNEVTISDKEQMLMNSMNKAIAQNVSSKTRLIDFTLRSLLMGIFYVSHLILQSVVRMKVIKCNNKENNR